MCVYCRCLHKSGAFAFVFEISSEDCTCYTEDNEKLHCLAKNDVTDDAHQYFYIKKGLSKPICEPYKICITQYHL